MKKDIEEQGLLTVEYSNGRKVSVSSYAAMAARSARMESANIGAFGRSYRAKEGSPAHQRSHNLIRDYQKYTDYKQVLKEDPDFPKTLAKFQEIKYNKDVITYQRLKRENATISSIKKKGWSETFTKKAISAYYEFKAKNIEFTDHGIARFLQRGFDMDTVLDICKNYSFNFIQEDGKRVKFYKGLAIIYSTSTEEIVSIVQRDKPKKEWENV